MNETLRQSYAKSAMQGICASGPGKEWTNELIAAEAFAIADAMIKFEQNHIKTYLEETVLGTPIATTILLVYVLNKLKEIPVNNLNDLVTMTEIDLLRLPNIGRKAVNDIKAMLDQYGLKLADR